MKKIIVECLLILGIALAAAILFNLISGNNIQFIKKYEIVEPVEQAYNIETIDIDIFNYYRNRPGTIILDARTEREFASGHIPGAVSFSVARFEPMFTEQGELLKLGTVIVIYCAGPDCRDSSLLASRLSGKGFSDIFVFKGGMEEWIGAGFETAAGAGR